MRVNTFFGIKALAGKKSTLKPHVTIIFLAMVFYTQLTFKVTAQSNIWVQKSDVGYDTVNVNEPTAREGSIGFSIGNKGYLGTGNDKNGSQKDLWEYDTTDNTWTQKADFGGTARTYAVGFSIGNKGYIGTGIGVGGYYKDFWEYDPADNTWTQKEDFGGIARYDAVGFSIGNKGYIGLGATPYFAKDFWEYNPVDNTWTQKADFGGGGRTNAVGLSIGNKGFIGTGYQYDGTDGKFYKDFWEYDVGANAWTQKADFGGPARRNAVAFSIGAKGYIGTGSGVLAEEEIAYKDIWEYDTAANKWTQKTDFAGYARYDAIAFNIGNKAYIGTGYDEGMSFMFKNDFWEYDGLNDDWVQKADFSGTGRSGAIGLNIGNKGFVGMGYGEYVSYKKDLLEYNPVSDNWTQKADFLGTARANMVGFNIGTKAYAGTGNSTYPSTFNDFWEYDMIADTWSQKADVGETGRTGAAAFSIGSKGYLGTGNNKDFWEYDPNTNIWTQKADFGGTSRYRAVGFSIGSKGYIGTGSDDNGERTKDFWEYDPSTDKWTKKADFGGIGRYYAVGFSIGNKGYIGTGADENGNPRNDFWEYNPKTDTWIQKADFAGLGRLGAAGFSIGNKGYIATGTNHYTHFKDMWEYTPENNCLSPADLTVVKISDTCVKLNWSLPDSSVEHIKISYRAMGSPTWIEDRKRPTETNKTICGLTPNTTYEWKLRNICADNKTGWVHGPNFTTTYSVSFLANAVAINSKVQGNISVQVMPNPSTGNFTLQMYLPDKAASTIIALYNNLGEKIWQQDAGKLSGSVSKNIALESKLPTGVYVLMIQQGDARLMQKVVLTK